MQLRPALHPAQVLKALAALADDRRPHDSDIGFASCTCRKNLRNTVLLVTEKGNEIWEECEKTTASCSVDITMDGLLELSLLIPESALTYGSFRKYRAFRGSADDIPQQDKNLRQV